jgi:ankyrin repeat protein
MLPLAPKGPKHCDPAIITDVTVAGHSRESSTSTIKSWNSGESIEGRRIITFETESCRASDLNINSLRKGLAFKTESYLEDIISILHNFTTTGSTKSYSKLDQGSSWNNSSNTPFALRKTDLHYTGTAEKQTAPTVISQENVLLEHALPLPGSFARQVANPRKAGRTLVRKRANELRCLCETGASTGIRISHVCNNTEAIDIHQVDSFGNTALHIATASGSSPESLLHIINLGADIHALNSAGQTFLHLIPQILVKDCEHLGYLLTKLQNEGFKFHLRDDHGQTPLHPVTRHWMDKPALEGIAKSLLSSEITLPASRDNLGRTILGQMTDVGLEITEIDRLRERAAVQIVVHSDNTRVYGNESKISPPQFNETENQCVPNYGPCTFIQTVEDLQINEYHSDLLRTIVRAGSLPQYEDTEGRNGLHCLAELSPNLLILCGLPLITTDEDTETTSTQREAYLSNLLKAGIDPDNCDKGGTTPFMAFITHTRNNEDDNTTLRILSRLCEAGVNINRRDRNGQTPLHLAVKLGKAAVTRFLLRSGANIHVRDSEGMGVIAMGQAHSKNPLNDGKMYAQIMMCISLVVGAGAVSAPTRLQEWHKT